jgi:class 3 adenylate cyclase
MSIRESIAALLPFVRGRSPQRDLAGSFTGQGTVMTWDIVRVSHMLEGCYPEELLSALNAIAGVCVHSIEESSGQALQNIGDSGLAFWPSSPSDISHAVLAFRCGAMMCTRLAKLKSTGPKPDVRIALGTGAMAGVTALGRLQIFGVASSTAKRLLELDLPRRTSMLYTSETLAFLEGETPRTVPVARLARRTGEALEVYEYCDSGS